LNLVNYLKIKCISYIILISNQSHKLTVLDGITLSLKMLNLLVGSLNFRNIIQHHKMQNTSKSNQYFKWL